MLRNTKSIIRHIRKEWFTSRSKLKTLLKISTQLQRLLLESDFRELYFGINGDMYLQMENGIKLWINLSDPDSEYGDGQNLILNQVVKNEVAPTYIMSCLFLESETFIDVGANNGYIYSIQAAKAGIKNVIAYEPNPRILKHLYKNIAINSFTRIIRVRELAISSRDDVSEMSIYNSASSHLMVQQSRSKGSITVQTCKLDSEVVNLNIEGALLMKIDVEGFEWDVLFGARETIMRFRPIVMLEINRKIDVNRGISVESIEKLLDTFGYVHNRIRMSDDYLAYPKERELYIRQKFAPYLDL